MFFTVSFVILYFVPIYKYTIHIYVFFSGQNFTKLPSNRLITSTPSNSTSTYFVTPLDIPSIVKSLHPTTRDIDNNFAPAFATVSSETLEISPAYTIRFRRPAKNCHLPNHFSMPSMPAQSKDDTCVISLAR